MATNHLLKFRDHRGLLAVREKARRRGEKVVFTNGCFDILHAGHVKLLRFAKRRGSMLFVAVNSDASVRKIKGPGRPVFSLQKRLEMLGALAEVDFLTSFAGATPRRLISILRPDVLVKGADWGPDEVVGREEVEAAGGLVLRCPIVKGLSTTGLIGHRQLRR